VSQRAVARASKGMRAVASGLQIARWIAASLSRRHARAHYFLSC